MQKCIRGCFLSGFKVVYLLFVKIAPFADLKLFKLDLADRHTGELKNAYVVALAHAAYLSVSALKKLKTRDSAVVGLTDLGDLYRYGHLAVNVN